VSNVRDNDTRHFNMKNYIQFTQITDQHKIHVSEIYYNIFLKEIGFTKITDINVK